MQYCIYQNKNNIKCVMILQRQFLATWTKIWIRNQDHSVLVVVVFINLIQRKISKIGYKYCRKMIMIFLLSLSKLIHNNTKMRKSPIINLRNLTLHRLYCSNTLKWEFPLQLHLSILKYTEKTCKYMTNCNITYKIRIPNAHYVMMGNESESRIKKIIRLRMLVFYFICMVYLLLY